jgi:hypothetical protein
MKHLISILLLVLYCSVLWSADSKPTTDAMTQEQAFQVLLKANSFGFGAKFGQKERKTDTAYKLLLSGDKQKKKFKKLFKEGNIYSKLYSLCVLWHLDNKEFQKLIKGIDRKEKIYTQSGCLVGEETVGDIISKISHSVYEYEFIKSYKLKRIAEKQARVLFKNYLKKIDKETEGFVFNLKPFGNSTWVVDCYNKYRQPSIPWRHVMDSRGDIKELNMDSLNVVFLNEFPLPLEEKDRQLLIKDFINLHAGERVSIINKVSDIPGIKKAPVDLDIAEAIRAPFSFGNLTTVVYTYQQISGIVRRYRFQFKDKKFKHVDCSVLGKGIGNAQYYK